MLKIKEYVKAESLEQAYELNQKRTNCILGGMLWLKMSNRNVQKAIDLSGLGLNQIEETEEEFRIGCMTTLRELECHERLNQWCEGAVKDAVSDIVGVQFRNLATIGGSIFGRYGFSDVLTMFLAMAMPRPVPCTLVVRRSSARLNGSNMIFWNSGVIPMPLSSMENS